MQTPAAEKQADYKNKKERDALRRKHKARITKLEQEIAETDDTLTALNASLSEPENACSYEKTLSLTEEIDRTQHHLDTLYEEWESISLLLDELSDT